MMNRPVYAVLFTRYPYDALAQRFGICHLVKVVACDLSEWDAVFKREVLPFQSEPPYMNWELFDREPQNIFRQMASEAGSPESDETSDHHDS